ncbi:hypothetical protein NCS57_01112600 [Fusarium keratoplasticum]|uniref:Uncharacterized protein n=1 Tax=Fusarium keratoplasticum TaxID=1328300 RepID=A0ACC0QL93_9HYPO|nr:hypothetical protein NCS57_01112600 [Fusarium keratoplasticum]KAI8657346.1 hypothetical protein NCS57_01112600 [Fusarium keratoplasticum]
MPASSKNTNVQAVSFPIGCSVMAKPVPKEAVGFPIGCNVMAKPGPKEAVGFPIGSLNTRPQLDTQYTRAPDE